METERRASVSDENVHLIRVVESAAGASSSRDVAIAGGTANNALIRTVLKVTKLQRCWVKGNQTHWLVDRRRFALHVCFTYHSHISFFMHWVQLHVFLCVLG